MRLQSLACIQVLALRWQGVAQVQRGKHSGLPNEHWSSDHIALMAEFVYRVPPVPPPG